MKLFQEQVQLRSAVAQNYSHLLPEGRLHQLH